MIFFLFTIWRLIDFIIAFFTPRFIPYLGFFAYQKDLAGYHLPRFVSSFANFDGMYYLRIAEKGYQQYEQAFFPLYPLLIRLLTLIFKNPLITGLVISDLSFFIGLIFFKKYLQLTIKPSNHVTILTIVFFLLFPTSFFFGAVYTEGLFFLLVVLTFYLLKKEKIILAGVFSFFAALTRFVGVFLFIPFLINLLFVKKNLRSKIYSPTEALAKVGHLISMISPILGLASYMFFLWKITGDPLNFFHSQTVFGPARSTKLIILPQVYFRYLKILSTAKLNFQYFVSLFELTVFSFVFVILLYELYRLYKLYLSFRSPDKIGTKEDKLYLQNNYFSDRLQLNLFSLVNILVPTLTGSFLSVPRFALLSLSFFIFLGRIKNVWLTGSLLILFSIFHILFLAFFIQGYFVS